MNIYLILIMLIIVAIIYLANMRKKDSFPRIGSYDWGTYGPGSIVRSV